MGTAESPVTTAVADGERSPMHSVFGTEMTTQKESQTNWAKTPSFRKTGPGKVKEEVVHHQNETSKRDEERCERLASPSPSRPKTPTYGGKMPSKLSPKDSPKQSAEKAEENQEKKVSVPEPAMSPIHRIKTPTCEVPKRTPLKKSLLPDKPSPRNDTITAKKTSLRRGIGIMDEQLERILAELESQVWYHGFLPFEDIAGLLHNDGDFLIRAADPVGDKPPVPCITAKWGEVVDYPIH
ncbi:hypothetical protein GCK32_014240, partial [Trichostrongylus colubriformis]